MKRTGRKRPECDAYFRAAAKVAKAAEHISGNEWEAISYRPDSVLPDGKRGAFTVDGFTEVFATLPNAVAFRDRFRNGTERAVMTPAMETR